MSLEGIYKNLYSLLEVIQNSRSAQVAHWNNQSFENAIQWTEFGEQIFRQSRGKPYSQHLDAEVRKIGCLPLALGSVEVNLAFLENCKHHLILCLLQNRHLPPNLLEIVVRYCATLSPGYRSIAQDFAYSLCNQRLVDNLLTPGLASGHSDGSGGETDIESKSCAECDPSQLLSDIHLRSEAQLLLQHIASKEYSLTQADTSSQHYLQLHDQFESKLHAFMKSDHGLKVAVTALLVASTAHDKCQERAGRTMLDWILSFLDAGNCQIWSLSPSILVSLFKVQSSLLERYLGYLSQCGKKLRPDYDNIRICSAGVVVSWRPDDDSCAMAEDLLSYSSLKSRIEVLCKCDSPTVAAITQQTVSEWASIDSRGPPNLWAELLRNIQ